jgi:oxygen-independent coproporphyrinogen-3 oxidase
VLYWQGGEYFGCGPSAHSHWHGGRYGNLADLPAWCGRMQAGERPFDEVERLSAEEKARETLVMWLRLTAGVELETFAKVTGFSVDALCGDAVHSMLDEGLLEQDANRIRLSRNALFVCNSVFSELL